MIPATAVLSLFGLNRSIIGLLIIIAGLINATRLYRWQLWRCKARLDIIGFGIGYAWLSVGIIAMGVAVFLNVPSIGPLHLVTIGAIGSLSSNVMARLHFQREYRKPPPNSLILVTLLLIAASALLRFCSEIITTSSPILLWLSAISWAMAFLWLAVCLIKPQLSR